MRYRSALAVAAVVVIETGGLGTLTTSGSTVTVRNASYNGSVPASGSTTFGFLADGTPSAPTPTCVSP